MKPSRSLFCGLFILFAVLVEIALPLCVLESDFGFKINCAFKKSGLFRVRNLGGIKAHASLGFSLGDELGFEQSLTNQDPSRRRSVSFKNGAPNILVDTSSKAAPKQEKRAKQNRIMMRPMASGGRPNQAAMDKLSTLHRRVSSTMQPIVITGPPAETPLYKVQPTVTMAKPMPMGIPPFKPLPPKDETLRVVPLASTPTRKTYSPLPVPQSKGPGLPYQSEIRYISPDNMSKMVSHMTAIQYQPIRKTSIKSHGTLNPFVPMPPQPISIIPSPNLYDSSHKNFFNANSIPKTNPLSNFLDPVPHQVHDIANMYSYNTKKVDDYNSISGYSDDVTLKFTKDDINAKIAEIAKAGNISMEAVEAAIALRQQQLLSKYANIPVPTTTTSTTTTTTTEAVVFQLEPEPEIVVAPVPHKPKPRNPTSGKVMNAPREYYPVGYEKNFDDHFQSKVDLPDTNFHCGDQKYFPGLYGDEQLGCMVFHVCALTDDGLVMKSFLCPESTLFDQTILKCNWWFYVDCKNTVKLYDTNIPVSKSYQLMKALTFFSSYKKEMGDVSGQQMNPEDVEGIKGAITILENQDSRPASNDNVEIVTPSPATLPIIDERHSNNNDTSPVYRGTRDYTNSTEKRNIRRNPQPQENGDSYKLVTVNANINFNNTGAENNSSENSSDRRRRRIMSRNNYSTSTKATTTLTTTTTTTTTTTINTRSPEVTTPSVEIIKQEIQPIQNITPINVKQEKLTDQLDNLEEIDHSILKEAENSPPVRRFYRSSQERYDNVEDIQIINNEKVQIVRPTSSANFVGANPTQTETIAKLDEAILGKRFKKEALTIVVPTNYEIYRRRDRT